MNLKIAIQPDEVVHRNGERQSFSERWMELAPEVGVTPKRVNVFAEDAISQIAQCDAFMWRCSPSAYPRLYAKRLMPALEQGLRLPVFPSGKSSWYFEDKIGQYYLLVAGGIPTPETHVSWSRAEAEASCDAASYPFVLKLSSGYQSSNVRLVRNRSEAQFYIDQMFGPGLTGVGYRPASGLRRTLRRLRAASELAKGRFPNSPNAEMELQHGYFYSQEFLPDNDFDTRVTVIGNRAFAFRRFNRESDFRASGSGLVDWDADKVEESAVRLAFRVARMLESQSVGVDVLRKDGQPVVVELTLSYAAWALRDCPGHWVLQGEPDSGSLEWQAGSLRPEDAIFTDFVDSLRRNV